MNILVTVETKPRHRALLEVAAPQAEFTYKESGVTRADVERADVLLGNVSPALLSPADRLRWMQTASAGVDGYIHGCLPREAVLTNATGAYGLAISEYMVAVWLMLLKKLHLYRDAQPAGAWADLGPVASAWGSTVLVLGLGDIGGEFAKRAKALGARVIGVRRAGREKPDFVDELIHTDREPLPADHPLWKQKNAVITPHVSGGFHLEETHERIIRIMAENLAAYCAGRPLRNVVDFETGYRKL